MRRTTLLLVVALLVSCTHASTSAFHPSVTWGKCPGAVEVQYVSRHRCGYLTVLQDRSRPARGTLKLFVAESWPSGSAAGAGFVLRVGSNLGQPADYGMSGSLATRVSHRVLDIDLRGNGYSQPSLACPEVTQLGPIDAAPPSDDPSVRAEFLAAVKACHARLVRQGVELSQFDVSSTAHDLEDLRTAMGVQRWWAAATFGTASRYLFEYLREFPGRTRAAWADSPQLPQIDEVTGGIDDSRSAIEQLFKACAGSISCDRAFPHLAQEWQTSLVDLGSRPIHTTVRSLAGSTVRVTLDAPKLLRAVRNALGADGPAVAAGVPAMIDAAARGRLTWGLVTILTNGLPYRVGYLPECSTTAFSLGTYLTVFCMDEAPFIDAGTLSSASGADDAYRVVFAQDPYLAACAVWDVPTAPAAVHEPLQSSVPLLLMTGQFDPYAQPDATRIEASTLPNAWVLPFQGQTHNVLGFSDCPISIRNAWVDTLQPASTATSCINTMPNITFTTSTG